jgi:hypothetical protein
MNNEIRHKLNLAAYHEMGHVTMTYYLGYECEHARILTNPNNAGNGKIRFANKLALFDNRISNGEPLDDVYYRMMAKDYIWILLAGKISEKIYLLNNNFSQDDQITFDNGSESDLEKVNRINKILGIQICDEIIEIASLIKEITFQKNIITLSNKLLETQTEKFRGLDKSEDDVKIIHHQTIFSIINFD